MPDQQPGSSRQPRTRAARSLAPLLATAVLSTAVPALTPGAAHGSTPGGPPPLAARSSVDCTHGRLRLTLENHSGGAGEFTVHGPNTGTRTTRTVAAGSSVDLHWTRPAGARYTLRTTAPGGFTRTASGRVNCGLERGTPGMNTTRLFSPATRFQGMLGADGRERPGRARSVRIPAMAVTNDGTVLAATDARVDGSSDLPANIQVGLRRSTDNGASWSAPRIVAHADSVRKGTGDSSLLVDRTTGRVFLFYNLAGPGAGFFDGDSDSNAPDDPNSQHIQYVSSDDNGASWSRPTELNPQVKDPRWQNLFASSGHGIQTDRGRLIQPIVYRDRNDVTHSANIVSDDHGRTWRSGAPSGSETNESKPVQRGAGGVTQNMRHNTDKRRYHATSPDGAQSFSPMTASGTLIDPLNNGDELSWLRPQPGLPARTRTVLFSNTASTSERSQLTVRLSRDDGASWPQQAVLKSGTAGYSTMAVLRDGSVGTLYEVGETGGIHFARFTAGWLHGTQ